MISADTLGVLLLKNNILTESDFETCMDKYLELRGRGDMASLCQIILEFGIATVAQLNPVVEQGNGELRKCKECLVHFAVESTSKEARPRCPSCRADLTLVESAYKIPAYGAKSDELIGKEFSGFRLLKRLGEGATGVVYLGERTGDGERASVKVLAEALNRDPTILKRFRREALAGDLLDHPGICKLIDTGEAHGRMFLALQYADGHSLEHLRAAGTRVSQTRAVMIAKKLLEALDFAHRSGISHRDIKPENVIVSDNDHVHLIDFGVAKDESAETILTAHGGRLGSPAYMSPEQAEGDRGGPLSDIHACGMLLFVLLTGRRPFDGGSMEQVMENVATKEVASVSSINPDVSASVDDVIRCMMAKNPNDRYATAGAAVKALTAALEDPFRKEPLLARDDESGGDRPPWLLPAAIGGGVILILVLWLLLK